jgi:hypothetical protein
MRNDMRKSMIVAAALLITLGATVSNAAAQVMTAQRCMAAGFEFVPPADPRVIQQLAAAGTLAFEGKREERAVPRWVNKIDTMIGCGWAPHPAAEMIVQATLQLPEDPPFDDGGSVDEPAGRRSFMGGVVTYRKRTSTYGGIGTEPDLVTYDGQWMGAVSGGLMGVSVTHALSKEAIASWMTAVIGATGKQSP